MDESSDEVSSFSPIISDERDRILETQIIENLTSPAEQHVEDAGSDVAESFLSLTVDAETACIDDASRFVIKPRAYQSEMVEESLQRNIIVAMDTGSGKTHVAVMRVLAELDRMPSHQFIWFLAPTISLCNQQYEYFQKHITSIPIKLLSGNDGIDRWTEQSHWDTVLRNVKLLVTTYQVLLDALAHAFVQVESLALIIFDEAHNCVRKHPGAQIMQKFYHPRKTQGKEVPHILGLTASPVMRSDPQSLVKIEETLDAICRTPTKHRAELRAQVKLPVLSQILYQGLPPDSLLSEYTQTIKSLGRAYASLKILEDPYVLALRAENTERSRKKLEKVRLNHKTWTQDQLKNFHSMSLKVCRELGPWAADYYISEVVTRYLKLENVHDSSLGMWDIPSAERRYLGTALRQVIITQNPCTFPPSLPMVSNKFTKLLEAVLQEPPNFSGIVFAQERTMVSVLAHMLSIHPDTRSRFRVGSMVGSSDFRARPKNISELVDTDSRKLSLERFKSGTLNLMIATSVLEEGIDVPSCNVVICFQKPANLKSFIQRRGRARQKDSKLILFDEIASTPGNDWSEAESSMRRMYEDDMRSLKLLIALEEQDEHDGRYFKVGNTGALLDLDNALSHLHHFCATLPKKQYIDPRPDFTCIEAGARLVKAKVVLPLSVNEAVRTTESSRSWASEKNSMKDAAFEAYLGLYKAGLINDNLLPLAGYDADITNLETIPVESRPSKLLVREQINPWIRVAKKWESLDAFGAGDMIRQATISFGKIKMQVYLPADIPSVPPYKVYWDENTELDVSLHTNCNTHRISDPARASRETLSLLRTAYGTRYPIEQKRHVVLFSTDNEKLLEERIEFQSISEFVYDCQLTKRKGSVGLVRDLTQNNQPYIYRSWLAFKPPVDAVQHPYLGYSEAPKNVPHLSLSKLSKRSDFLHKIPKGNAKSSEKPLSYVLPTTRCSIDTLPFEYVQFALIIPCIIHRLGIYLLADRLSKTILQNVGIIDLTLIVTAISASSAREETNYQRLEFLGDSILKTCTSIQLMAEYPLWHQGYLSAKKDRLVANSRLARAAIEVGLDEYILTKAFTGQKWRPLYVEDLLASETQGGRELSTKILGDVVESLIGAAMVDGGITKALSCLQVFLPELTWHPLEARRASLFDSAADIPLPAILEPLEEMIGYRFQRKSLLIEALTHASYNVGSGSLERLEFLGDAILDNIVVEAMFRNKPELSHVQMHLLRTALVNADFLAFCCMEWSTAQTQTNIVETTDATEANQPVFHEVTSTLKFPLWKFMRHMCPPVAAVQEATSVKYGALRNEIKDAIERGTHYPWHQLTLLAGAPSQKFYSDLIESVLGAVWIDSGSFEACRDIVEKLGILSYMRRILSENVHILHPKEEIGQLADTETVKYMIGYRVSENADGFEEREYHCRVLIAGREIASVDGGIGREEVMTRAADLAVKKLKSKHLGDAPEPEMMDSDVEMI
ncbi:p-loop containing nucleoside triphosphate hydrolase-27 [Coleophoma cylindrospora]|uniref:p-loop containing nucleoside triphosphate hydrolase-27 n=1 Tax=Coleophoma cylindrospora TaxID=1849047 RepID=A0A3D8S7E1_9HELO|nr:p-loop containing nucleoside triphosphate hydrolase-27 [Coleophoma cylindrospora]